MNTFQIVKLEVGLRLAAVRTKWTDLQLEALFEIANRTDELQMEQSLSFTCTFHEKKSERDACHQIALCALSRCYGISLFVCVSFQPGN